MRLAQFLQDAHAPEQPKDARHVVEAIAKVRFALGLGCGLPVPQRLIAQVDRRSVVAAFALTPFARALTARQASCHPSHSSALSAECDFIVVAACPSLTSRASSRRSLWTSRLFKRRLPTTQTCRSRPPPEANSVRFFRALLSVFLFDSALLLILTLSLADVSSMRAQLGSWLPLLVLEHQAFARRLVCSFLHSKQFGWQRLTRVLCSCLLPSA